MSNFVSTQNMTRIDGEKIRRIREQKGLTQLYLATVVEVTTDTISRWENKRYPTIKQENAVKLAEALEVTIEEILENETDQGKEQPLSEVKDEPLQELASPQPSKPRPLIGLLILILLLIVGGGAWWFFSRPIPVLATVERHMPLHIPAGEIFPVVVQIHTDQQESFSLLLKETIPAGFQAENSFPVMASTGSTILKWVSRTSGTTTTFTYQVRAPQDGLQDHQYGFSGAVILGQGKKSPQQVGGSATIELTGFHWADSNKDNVIDDEEILTAYDSFSSLDELNFNWDQIDEIWIGQGYQWDANSRQYIIIP